MAERGDRWRAGLLGVVLLALACGCATAAPAVDWAALFATAPVEPGARSGHFSAAFRDTPYRAGTLGGGPEQPETLVVNLAEVDCLTLLEYVEALRRCRDFSELPEQLRAVRYRGGELAWATRRHFFTDWAAADQEQITDVTALVGGPHTRTVTKQLNRAADGGMLLPGVAVTERTVAHIPTAALDAATLARLRAGDYLGIYSDRPGLDVSHTGLLVRDGERWLLRHASSKAGAVVDSELRAYLAGTPGLVVLRVRRP